MQTINFYRVTESYDRASNIVARFSNKEDAVAFVETHPNKNYMRADEDATTLIIFESVSEQKEYSDEMIRHRALAKLTDKEKLLLGLCT